jgi:hypothetical protein
VSKRHRISDPGSRSATLRTRQGIVFDCQLAPVEYGSLIQRLEEQDAEAEQMEDKLTHMAREVDSSRLNAGEYPVPMASTRKPE